MSGRRLLDAIQFLNVTKSVAAKHLAVRQRQLDVFTRTSSLTKGIQSQAEGLILSAKAAAALARRFNEPDHPPKTSDSPLTSQTLSGTKSEDARSPSLSPDEARKAQRQAESHIPVSGATYSGGEVPEELRVSQQQDVFYEPSLAKTPELSGLPRVKLPKAGGKEQVGIDGEINADVFHSPVSDTKAASDVKGQSEKEDMAELGTSMAENAVEQEVY